MPRNQNQFPLQTQKNLRLLIKKIRQDDGFCFLTSSTQADIIETLQAVDQVHPLFNALFIEHEVPSSGEQAI